MAGGPIDRASADDVVSLATDVGPARMQVGAVLLLDTAAGFDVAAARVTLGERIRAVPRLRQRLERTPLGCGRPIWVDAGDFDLDAHVDHVTCTGSGGLEELLELAAAAINEPLPGDRPLWRIRVVTGLRDDRTAMVVAFHHVLADGIGGLAVLAHLVDGASGSTDQGSAFPRPRPSVAALAGEAMRSRLAALTRLPDAPRRAREAIGQFRAGRTARARPCSLNRPTGPRRRYAVVRTDLAGVAASAHRHGVTVNDVALVAMAGALGELVRSRGETVDRFVISVPVSRRRPTDGAGLGNRTVVVPVEIGGVGDPGTRLRAASEATGAAKATAGDAASLLGPLFRALAAVGLFTWFVDHQRVVHAFSTNLAGPAVRLSFGGSPVTEIIGAGVISGNVSVSFALLSYAGDLTITVIADPDACPDLHVLSAALEGELARLTALDGA